MKRRDGSHRTGAHSAIGTPALIADAPLTDRLRAYLGEMTGCVTYNDAIMALSIVAQPRMRQLTDALEALMADDAMNGRPFLAARVVSRGSGIPAAGFFQAARALGVVIPDEPLFHAQTIALLDRCRRETE